MHYSTDCRPSKPLSPPGDDLAVLIIGVKSQLFVFKIFYVSGTADALTLEKSYITTPNCRNSAFRRNANNKRQTMTYQKNPVLTPLVIAAALSVLAFSGIGVAAITGHLSITNSSLNPFSSFSNMPASGIIQAPAVQTAGHQGLTRHRGETPAEGKPVNFQFGARVPARKPVCPDCGVVDSISPGTARPRATGITRSLAAGSEGATSLKVAGQAGDEQGGSGRVEFVVTVHMENGTVRTIYESERPSFNIGERIKLVNGTVIRIG